MVLMGRDNFLREFKYTKRRIARIATHDLHENGGNGRDMAIYSKWKSFAAEKLKGFGARAQGVGRLPFGFYNVPSELAEDMKRFRRLDSKYCDFYEPPIDRADLSVAY